MCRGKNKINYTDCRGYLRVVEVYVGFWQERICLAYQLSLEILSSFYYTVCREDGSIDFLGIQDRGYVSVVHTNYFGSPTPTTPPIEQCPLKIKSEHERVKIPKGCFSTPFIAVSTRYCLVM